MGLTRKSLFLAVVIAIDAVVLPLLVLRAEASLTVPACRTVPDACAAYGLGTVSSPVGLPLALFVIGSETVMILFVGFSNTPKGSLAAKSAAAIGLGGISLFVLASSRALISLDPSLTPFKFYSIMTSLFVSNPARYSDATGLYYGLSVYDVQALALLAIGLAGTFLLFRKGGDVLALVRTLRVAALLASFLALNVAIFDFGEFFIHATAIQSEFSIMTWFTNADLLVAGLSLTTATFLFTRARGS